MVAVVESTLADELRSVGYVCGEMPREASTDERVEAILGALAVACVAQARMADQLDQLSEVVAKLSEVVAAVAPMAEQLAAGGPGALLGLLTRRG